MTGQADAPCSYHCYLDRLIVLSHSVQRCKFSRTSPLPTTVSPRIARLPLPPASALCSGFCELLSSARERVHLEADSFFDLKQRKRRRRFKLPLPYYSHDFPSSLRSHRYEVDAKVHSSTRWTGQRRDYLATVVFEREFSESLARKISLALRAEVLSCIVQIVPIGALFSGSLIFNNLAYTTLSVPFIQM